MTPITPVPFSFGFLLEEEELEYEKYGNTEGHVDARVMEVDYSRRSVFLLLYKGDEELVLLEAFYRHKSMNGLLQVLDRVRLDIKNRQFVAVSAAEGRGVLSWYDTNLLSKGSPTNIKVATFVGTLNYLASTIAHCSITLPTHREVRQDVIGAFNSDMVFGEDIDISLIKANGMIAIHKKEKVG